MLTYGAALQDLQFRKPTPHVGYLSDSGGVGDGLHLANEEIGVCRGAVPPFLPMPCRCGEAFGCQRDCLEAIE